MLEEEALLSTVDAVKWLGAKGIKTSRRGLENARNAGRLRYFETRGRIRVMYRRSDLAAAFLRNYVTHDAVSASPSSRSVKAGKFLTREERFQRARELARRSKGKR